MFVTELVLRYKPEAGIRRVLPLVAPQRVYVASVFFLSFFSFSFFSLESWYSGTNKILSFLLPARYNVHD